MKKIYNHVNWLKTTWVPNWYTGLKHLSQGKPEEIIHSWMNLDKLTMSTLAYRELIKHLARFCQVYILVAKTNAKLGIYIVGRTTIVCEFKDRLESIIKNCEDQTTRHINGEPSDKRGLVSWRRDHAIEYYRNRFTKDLWMEKFRLEFEVDYWIWDKVRKDNYLKETSSLKTKTKLR